MAQLEEPIHKGDDTQIGLPLPEEESLAQLHAEVAYIVRLGHEQPHEQQGIYGNGHEHVEDMLVHQRAAEDKPVVIGQHQQPVAYEEAQHAHEAEVAEQCAEGEGHEHEHPYQVVSAQARHHEVAAQHAVFPYGQQHEGLDLLHRQLGHGEAHEEVHHEQVEHPLVEHVVRLHRGKYLAEEPDKQETEHDEIHHPQGHGKAHEVFGKLVLVVHRVPLAGYLAQTAQLAEEIDSGDHLMWLLGYLEAKIIFNLRIWQCRYKKRVSEQFVCPLTSFKGCFSSSGQPHIHIQSEACDYHETGNSH